MSDMAREREPISFVGRNKIESEVAETSVAVSFFSAIMGEKIRTRELVATGQEWLTACCA
jgi:hypothetical protein